jgi:hypothetical protein
MLEALFWMAIGAFIGWNFPQPFWAKSAQEKIKNMFKNASD